MFSSFLSWGSLGRLIDLIGACLGALRGEHSLQVASNARISPQTEGHYNFASHIQSNLPVSMAQN